MLCFYKDKIIDNFYTTDKYKYNSETKSWETEFNPENYKRPIKLSHDFIDAKNNKKVLSKGEKLNIVIAKKLFEKGLKSISINKEQLIGKYIAKDIKNSTDETIIKAGFDITEEQLGKIINEKKDQLLIVKSIQLIKVLIF